MKKEQKFSKDRGLFANMQRGAFFVFFFFGGVVLFFFSGFSKKVQKRLSSCNFRVFLFCFVPPKGLSSKSFFLPIQFFSLLFFVVPFKIPWFVV